MKFRKNVLYGLAILLLFSPLIVSCNAYKDVDERRNLMIPKKSEQDRNSRYKEIDKRKYNNYKPAKKAKRMSNRKSRY